MEEQLSDGREWLFDTEQPSLADVSVYFPYDWIKWKKDLFDTSKFPHAIQVSLLPFASQLPTQILMSADGDSGSDEWRLT